MRSRSGLISVVWVLLALAVLEGSWLVFKNGRLTRTEESRRLAGTISAEALEAQKSNAAAATKPPSEANSSAAVNYAPWLKARGRDAGSLVAMWDLCRDGALLEEAARNFPEDPRVCAAMIGYLIAGGQDARPWAERLIAAEPQNPAGYYWKARMLFAVGKDEEALGILENAAGIKGISNPHLRERMITAREASLIHDGTLRQAAINALIPALRDSGNSPLSSEIYRSLKKSLQAAKDAGDREAASRVATIGVRVAEQTRLSPASSMIEELMSLSTLQTMIKELDPEMEYGAEGKTVAEKIRELEGERSEWQAFTKRRNRAGTGGVRSATDLDEAMLSEYMDRFILHGEKNAETWLDSLHGSAP